MQRLETATRDRRRRKRLAIHEGTAMGYVVSKPAGRDQMSGQAVNGKTVRGTCEVSGCIVCLQVDHNGGGRAGDIGQRGLIGNRRGSTRVCSNAQQTGSETGINQARNASALELMLIKYCIRDPETQASVVRINPTWQPEIDTALLESVLRTVVAGVAADHVERFNRGPSTVATDDRTSIERSCHFLFKWSVSNDLHGNGLITTEDIHSIQFEREQIEIALQICIIAHQHRRKNHAASLAGSFDCVTSILHLTAPRICQN